MSDLLLEPWRHIATATVPKPEAHAQPSLETKIVTEPAVLNAISDSMAAASSLKSVARDIREGKLSTTPKLNSLQDFFAKFNDRVETAAQKLMDKMDGAATTTEVAVEKFGGAVDKVIATAKAIDDAANQMTNGGPPLGNS